MKQVQSYSVVDLLLPVSVLRERLNVCMYNHEYKPVKYRYLSMIYFDDSQIFLFLTWVNPYEIESREAYYSLSFLFRAMNNGTNEVFKQKLEEQENNILPISSFFSFLQ